MVCGDYFVRYVVDFIDGVVEDSIVEKVFCWICIKSWGKNLRFRSGCRKVNVVFNLGCIDGF